MPTIYAAALNSEDAYTALAPAMGAAPYNAPPRAPVLYIKPALCRTATGAAIPCPADVPRLRMGGTLAVVIGRTARRVTEADALGYVDSYAVANDVSVPHDSLFRPAVPQLCRDGFCPIGPLTAAHSISPQALGIRTFLNESLACDASTGTLRRGVPRLLADITDFMTLDPGDIVLVGVSANAPLAGPGDTVRVEIDGLAPLTNPVVEEDTR